MIQRTDPGPDPIGSPNLLARMRARRVSIERELNLCFNRADLNPDYMKTLIFAAAAERYSELPDASAQKKRKELSGWVNEDSLNNENLWTFFEDTVSAVRMGQKCMELVLAGDVIIQAREEESA